MLFHEDQRSSQNRYALRKARLQIPRFHSFGGYSALACIISPADDFGNTLECIPIGGTMTDWVNAGSSSIWTQAVKSVVVKWDGVS